MSIASWILDNWSLSTCIGACTVGLGVGGIITLSNIGEDSTTHLFRYISDDAKPTDQSWSQVMDGKHFSDLPLVKRSYKKLLEGDKRYNDGNYIIYYGSAACPHCTGFLYNNLKLARGSVSPDRHRMSEGAWMKAFEFAKTDETLSQKKIKFLMYDDFPDMNMVNQSDDYWTLPWATWEYDDLKRGIARGNYIRNDRSAKEIRKIIDAAQTSLGKDDKGQERVPGTPTVIAYRNGKAAVFNRDVIEGLEKEQKQGEEMANEDILKRFIKHYYTYNFTK